MQLPKKQYFMLRKSVIFFLCFLVFSGLSIYYMNRQNETVLEHFIMHLGTVDNNIACHYINQNDALPSAEDKDFIPQPNSIFFHETSCSGGLNSRQACAIESAARAHPRRNVYVMFSGPVSDIAYQRSCIAKLRSFHNVGFARVHITDYVKNTPLEAMMVNGPFNKSKWGVEHTADVLRYLTLYKWGGVYLDTDMVVVKSLTPLGDNWVGIEDNSVVNNAGLAISMDHLGRKLAEALLQCCCLQSCRRCMIASSMLQRPAVHNHILSTLSLDILLEVPYHTLIYQRSAISEVSTTYRPDLWSHNGPGALTRVLHSLCNTSNIKDWSITTCQGLEVYSPEYLYPLHYSRNQEYFKTGELKNVDNAYTHHLWNKLTHGLKIEKDSPYEKLARKLCPTIYDMYGEEFGN